MDKMLWLAQLSYCCVEYLYILYICIVFFFVFDEENKNKKYCYWSKPLRP